MDLNIKKRLFIVCGASAGFGRAVAEGLAREGAMVIAIARREHLLHELSESFPGQVEYLAADLCKDEYDDALMEIIGSRTVSGLFINSGGPPPTHFLETTMQQWDDAYHSVLRWKVKMLKFFVPLMQKQKYGRVVLLESASIKQPVGGLVLSNSYRMAVAGMIKTLSSEAGPDGITLNILAPGFHKTFAAERVIEKRMKEEDKSREEILKQLTDSIPVRAIGDAAELASLAVWLLSPLSSYVTGQTITVDGGRVKFSLG